MGRVSRSIEVPEAPERVWAVATRIEDLRRWLPEVTSAELLDAPLAAGSRVRLRLSPSLGSTELVGTVRELDAPSRIVIAGSGGPLRVDVRTVLARNGTGTRVDLEIEVAASPLLGFIVREAERRIAAELPGALERFRALLAAESANTG
jgi:carbon monoxide dehydrogenase subunit G